jgi:hypothetical protein
MDQLIELLPQIQDLAGVAIDALQGGGEGGPPEGGPPEGGPPPEGGEGGPPPEPPPGG